MCRLSRKVQDSYCSVQNVQDKQEAPFYKGELSLFFGLSCAVSRSRCRKFCTQRAAGEPSAKFWLAAPLYNGELVLNILETAIFLGDQ